MMEKKLLIIDDDQHLLIGLAARLKASGYKVICATDAMTGINLAQKEAPDLIILDLGLPVDEGFVVLAQLRGRIDLASIPVIVLSARDPATNDQRAFEAGAVAFFQKPPDNNKFLGAIRQTLGEPVALPIFVRS